MRAFNHCPDLVLPLSTPTKKGNGKTQTTVSVLPVGSLPPVLAIEPTSQFELLDDDDFILVEKLSLSLETSTSVTSTPETKNADATSPIGLFICPGCQKHFRLFCTFVCHIETGTCTSAKSCQINGEINALASQLFSNLSVIWHSIYQSSVRTSRGLQYYWNFANEYFDSNTKLE